MNEKALIKQLKTLKNIEPVSQWIFDLKSDVFRKEKPAVRFMSWQTDWRFLKPTSLFAGVTMACLLLVVAFLNINNNFVDYTELNNLSGTLNEIETDLNSVAFDLLNKTVASPAQALEIQETIQATIKQGKEAVATAKEKSKNLKREESISREFLAVLNRVETALEAIGADSQEFERQTAEREIINLTGLSLSEKQKELFEKAKNYYGQGSYQQALIAIIELSQMK